MFPLTIPEIANAQQADKHLHKLFERGSKKDDKYVTRQYQMSLVEDTEVLNDKNLRLFLPNELRKRAVQWYHYYLQHPGHTRLGYTLRHVFTWPGMRAMVRSHVKQCQSCQFNKKWKLQYGHMPTRTL